MDNWKRQLKVTIEVMIDAPDDRVLFTKVDDAMREAMGRGLDALPYGQVVCMSNGATVRCTPENIYRENGVRVLMMGRAT